MADIYANSYATIISADKNTTTEGLCGLKDLTRSRSLHIGAFKQMRMKDVRYPEIDPYSPTDKVLVNNDILTKLSIVLMESDWASRGWTFQESLFSK